MFTNLRIFGRSALCALVLLVYSAPRLAAQNTATISGTVTDPSGAAIAGAALDAHNLATGNRIATTSDSQGRFRVPQLGLGDYEIQAGKIGFSTVVRKGITLTVGSESVTGVRLSLSASAAS